MAGDVRAQGGVKVRAQAGSAALFNGVAAGALGKGLFALRNIGLGQIGFKRSRVLAAFTFLNDTGNFIAHGFGPLFLASVEIARAYSRKAEQHDTGKQRPSGNGIETV